MSGIFAASRKNHGRSTVLRLPAVPFSPDGPHSLDPHRVRMEVVGPCVPVAAQVDDRHPAVEGARDRVAGPAGATVIVTDEYRAVVEHRYVPVEAAVSGIALAQAVHVVGLSQHFGI